MTLNTIMIKDKRITHLNKIYVVMRISIILLVISFLGNYFSSAVEIKVVESKSWYQFRGPARNGICRETGLLKEWKNGSPSLLWTVTNIGTGYSAPIFVNDRFFLAGDVDDDLVIFAFDIDGKIIWRSKNGSAWKGPYPGARASCTYSDGRLYHLNAHGRLGCFSALDGKELWAVNAVEKFGGKVITWGLGECVLVDENCVYVTVGGKQGLMAALNKTNGAVTWISEPLVLGEAKLPDYERVSEPAGDVDSASYASPIMFTIDKKKFISGCSLRHIYVIDAANGKLICTKAFPNRYQVIALMPVLVNDAIFFTAPDAGGGVLYKIEANGVLSKKLWTTPLDTCHGGVIALNGTLYGSYYRGRTGWVAVSLQDGSVRFNLKTIPMGSVLYADGRLYCLSQEGDMALVSPSSDNLEIVGQFRLINERKSDVWTHPVIYNKRLYLRYHNRLFCYDIAEN